MNLSLKTEPQALCGRLSLFRQAGRQGRPDQDASLRYYVPNAQHL